MKFVDFDHVLVIYKKIGVIFYELILFLIVHHAIGSMKNVWANRVLY